MPELTYRTMKLRTTYRSAIYKTMNYKIPYMCTNYSTYMEIQRETLPNMGKQVEWEDLRSKINKSQARCQIPLKLHTKRPKL